MPVFRHPPPGSNPIPEPTACSGHCYSVAFGAHIYLALAAIAVLIAARRFAAAQFGRLQQAPKPASTGQLRNADKDRSEGPEHRKDSAAAAAYTKWDSAVRSPSHARHQRGLDPQRVIRTAELSSAGAGAAPCQLPGQPPAMEGIDDARPKDPSGPASRGVSTSNPNAAAPAPRHQITPPSWPLAGPSGPSAQSRHGNRSPPLYPSTLSPRHRSGAADHVLEPRRPETSAAGQQAESWGISRPSGEESTASHSGAGMASLSHHRGDAGTVYPDRSAQRALPLDPPSLTPPVPTDAAFPFQDRRHSFAVSIPPELDGGFFDYESPSAPADTYHPDPRSATATPRRRSYTKGVSEGIPIPAATSGSSSSAETLASVDTFSPSSYPSTSPLLPPPPPGQAFPYEYEFVGGPGGPGILSSVQEVDIHGDIISSLDGADHGWMRHTRVYGGGICLACAAAGEQGGFYGDKVPLEDRR